MVGVLNGKKAFSVFAVACLLCGVFGGLVVEQSVAGTPAGSITYSAGTDTITVIGANSSHPCEFLDLYNADVAGGWGQVHMQNSTQFSFDCKIVVGNGSASTYFTDTGKEVLFTSAVVNASDQKCLDVKTSAVVTLGALVNLASKRTSRGVTFLDYVTGYNHHLIYTSGGVVYLYSFSASEPTGWGLGRVSLLNDSCRIYNGLLSGYSDLNIVNAVDVYNVVVQSTGASGVGLELFSSTAMVDSLFVQSGAYAVYTSGNYGFSISNLRVVGSTDLFHSYGTSVGNCNFTDAEVDTWGMVFESGSQSVVYRQYTFDLYVLNGALTDFVEDANVTLSHDGTVYGSWLTNSTGQIATQILVYGFYNATGGDTMYGGTAWTLTISHPDWRTYESSFYPYSEIDWSISMQEGSNGGFGLGLLLGVPLCVVGFAGGVLMFNRRR